MGCGLLARILYSGARSTTNPQRPRTLELRLLEDCAVSLGDTDSLIYHPASISRARQSIRKDAHLVEGVGEDLLRLSVGPEDVAI
ncbi:PLP-dependent transferase [Rhizobium leguminosarum]|uniref:PLP-dependent transferase n=1 Tax=Rhizobium leguminosarum TaxID=384 RepID=UPI0031F67D65